MKINLFQVVLILVSGFAFGQNSPISKDAEIHAIEPCSQHIRTQQMQLNDPARFATIGKRSTLPHQDHYSPSVTEKSGVVYTIPVVFHILHNNGAENISEAQVLDAMSILNRDYRRLNSDADDVDAAFVGMPTDAEIQFKLATAAPDGSCFDGITRTVTNLTNNGSDGQDQIQEVVSGNNVYQGIWPHNEYLNIYVAANIGGAAGYTFLPNGNSAQNISNMYYNGIFILDDYCGSIGTSSIGSSRALTHEVGHWLNLPHVWGGGNSPGDATNCNIDDGIQDTPDCKGITNCNLNANSCSDDDIYWGMAMKDNVENYMDYSYCSKMFTSGQVSEMRNALLSNVGGRSNIWTTANLQSVGAIPGSTLCSIDFDVNETTLCSGATISYTPNTTSGISTYSWTFPGGTPASSSVSNPTVTYNTPGNYDATLVVTSSSNGSNYSRSKSNYIIVNNGTTVNLPVNEPFSSAGLPSGWSVIDPNNGTLTWQRTTDANGFGGAGASYYFDNYNYNDPSNDELQVVKFSTTGMSSATLTFDVAYAAYNANNYDGLEVLVSTDCGNTYISEYLKVNTVLATGSSTTSTFIPTAGEWRTETIDLTPYVGEGAVLVSFKNLPGYGNRLYLDNINITGVNAAPSADFSASVSSPCVSQVVTFTDESISATSWNWNFGAGASPASAVGAGPHDVTYSSTGTKIVTLTINGGSVTNQNIVVGNPPSTPTISAGGATTFCSGENVVLTSSSATNNVWSNGSTTPSITVTTGNTYSVTVGAVGCASTSQPISVTVNPLPTVNFGSLSTVCSYDPVVSLTQGSPAGGSYSGTGVSGTQFDPALAGTGAFTLTYAYTDGNGCSNTDNSVIVVDNCLGIEEVDFSNFQVYPNPSDGFFTVVSDKVQMNSIQVYNQLGQLIVNQSTNELEQQLDLSLFNSGVYTLRVNFDSGSENIRVVLTK